MTEAFDVAIVGAGIHGAGVAQRAAALGHRALVLEKSAIAAGTSSRSSKLIHGGLRYLETGQLRLVRESLHERTALLRLAPELVRLQRFHIPIYRDTRRSPWVLRSGLALYAALAGFARGAAFGTLPRPEWETLDGLTTHGLRQVFWYHDAQTDDAALTRAVIASAQRLGAELRVPAELVSAELDPRGVLLRYAADRGLHEAHARVLINAAGPWAPDVARRVSPSLALPPVELVQGTHVALRGAPQRGIYYVESPRDGRAIFVMPYRGELLIGTTEVRFRGRPDTVAPTVGETHYLLGVLHHYFPGYRDAPIEHTIAGLRVLAGGTGHAFHRSRETVYATDRASAPRVVSILGGKYTTFRATAARALELAARSLPTRRTVADTAELPLTPV